MFKSGKIVNHNPILIEYPKDDFERLEPQFSKEKGFDDYQMLEVKYFSPFEKLNDFLGTNNPDFESVYIWNTYDKDKEIIQISSMKIDEDDLVLVNNIKDNGFIFGKQGSGKSFNPLELKKILNDI